MQYLYLFCKLLCFRGLKWAKIQGTYFKISALYFKIYGLCFLLHALCFLGHTECVFLCMRNFVPCRDSCFPKSKKKCAKSKFLFHYY